MKEEGKMRNRRRGTVEFNLCLHKLFSYSLLHSVSLPQSLSVNMAPNRAVKKSISHDVNILLGCSVT